MSTDTGGGPSAYEPPRLEPTSPPREPALAAAIDDVEPDALEPETEEEEEKPRSFFKELPLLILIAFGLALLIKTFLIQAFYIPSESMVPTLNIGDRVLVNKVVYKIREPRRGEIVVFVGQRLQQEPRSFWRKLRDALTSGFGGAQPAELDYIKRVIALPGETIQIERGVVRITPKGGGAPFTLDEPYIAKQRDLTPYPPTVVPEGSYFVLGDNRPNSSDSRTTLGPIKKSEIVGRAFVRIWPLSRFRGLGRPDYAGGVAGAALFGFARSRSPRRRRAPRREAA